MYNKFFFKNCLYYKIPWKFNIERIFVKPKLSSQCVLQKKLKLSSVKKV